MSPEIVKKFVTWRQEIMDQSQVVVPRCVTPTGGSDVQLHVMTDASAYAYAPCVYVRIRKG